MSRLTRRIAALDKNLGPPANLPVWSAAFRGVRAGTQDARIACIGDSVTLGVGAGISTAVDRCRQYSWPTLLAARLAQRVRASANSFAGDGGLVDSSLSYTVADPRVVLSAGWSQATQSFGGKMFANSTNTNALTFQPDGPVDTVDLIFPLNTGLGTMTVSTDGVDRQVINLNAAANVAVQTITFPVTTGPITVRRTTGNAFLVGMIARLSSQKEVSIVNAGYSGSRAAMWNAGSPGYNARYGITALGAELNLICLTVNDWRDATNASAYNGDLLGLVNRAKLEGDVLLLSGPPSAISEATLAEQQAILDQMAQVAVAASIPPPIYASDVFGTSYNAALMRDNFHPNQQGYELWTELIYSRLV